MSAEEDRQKRIDRNLQLLVQARRGVRKKSAATFLGLPLYHIALGPDLATGEVRGHARGILAIGDMANGWLAIGGVARGLVAVGGCAVGVVALGGAAFGGLAIGGGAVGMVALGGGAVGMVACGGGAIGYYACGGHAFGDHVLSATRQDPEMLELLKTILERMARLLAR